MWRTPSLPLPTPPRAAPQPGTATTGEAMAALQLQLPTKHAAVHESVPAGPKALIAGLICAKADKRMTAADVEWSVILGRLREIGFLDAELLAGLPHVARYSAKVWATPAFQQGVKALLRLKK